MCVPERGTRNRSGWFKDYCTPFLDISESPIDVHALLREWRDRVKIAEKDNKPVLNLELMQNGRGAEAFLLTVSRRAAGTTAKQ